MNKDMIKKYGEVFIDPNSIIDSPKKNIPISPALDLQTGGLTEGSIMLVSGPAKIGKTSMILNIVANAQKKENGARHTYYADVEHRLKTMNLTGINGLVTDMITIIRSTPGNILHGEKFLSIIHDLICTEQNAIFVIDSTSALCGEKEMLDEINGQFRSSTPKLLATFLRKITGSLLINNNTLILVQHLIANTSGYGSPVMEDSGNKIKFQSDLKIRAKSREYWKWSNDKEEDPVGQKIKWYIEYSSNGECPDKTTDGYLRYGYGMDDVMENIDIAISLNLINKTGAWLSFHDTKVQGMKKLHEHFNENQSDYTLLKQEIKNMIQ